jgi:kynurenine formamidase
MNTLIDLSQPLTDLMQVYPGDEPPHLEKFNDLEMDGFNNHRLLVGMHVGTHVDGPMHMTTKGQFLDEIPINQFAGHGVLLNAIGETVVRRKLEYESSIADQNIVMIYTGWSRFWGREEYYREYPIVSTGLAQLFIEKNVKMICLDSPSPDREPYQVHKLLFENNILIAENLTHVEKLLTARKFEVFALPLRIHADSAPARIVARILE